MQQVDELDAVSGVHDEGMRRYETKYRLGYSPSDATILEMATLKTQCTLVPCVAGATLHQSQCK